MTEVLSTRAGGGEAGRIMPLVAARADRELRDAAAAEAWICAGLCLARLQAPTAEALAPTLPWVLAAISDAPALPPVAMIVDVGCLLLGRPLDFAMGLSVHEPRLKAALRAYEDAVLGRLAGEPLYEAACDAVAKLDTPRRAEAIALLTEQLLARLGFREAVAVSPGVTRRLLQKPASELLERGLDELLQAPAGGGAATDALVAGYEALVRGARHAGALISPREVFTLENLTVLRGLTQRLAIEQMVEAAHLLERALPARMRRSTRRRGFTPTNIEDDSAYPTGGFSAISTSGSIESLVSSELIYMEDTGEIDLFDVRYAEGELLFYTRDESVFVRNRRVIVFALHPDLTQARFKDAGLPWQRLVILLGLVLCAVRRLADWLSHEALRVRLVFIRDAGASPLAAEQELARLLLREWIEKELVEVTEAQTLEELARGATAEARRADCSLVVVAHGAPPEPDRAGALHWVRVGVGQGWPTVSGPSVPGLAPPEAPTWSAWVEAARVLLQQLV